MITLSPELQVLLLSNTTSNAGFRSTKSLLYMLAFWLLIQPVSQSCSLARWDSLSNLFRLAATCAFRMTQYGDTVILLHTPICPLSFQWLNETSACQQPQNWKFRDCDLNIQFTKSLKWSFSIHFTSLND